MHAFVKLGWINIKHTQHLICAIQSNNNIFWVYIRTCSCSHARNGRYSSIKSYLRYVCTSPRRTMFELELCTRCGIVCCWPARAIDSSAWPNVWWITLWEQWRSKWISCGVLFQLLLLFYLYSFFYYFGFHRDVNIGLFLLSDLSMALCVRF